MEISPLSSFDKLQIPSKQIIYMESDTSRSIHTPHIKNKKVRFIHKDSDILLTDTYILVLSNSTLKLTLPEITLQSSNEQDVSNEYKECHKIVIHSVYPVTHFISTKNKNFFYGNVGNKSLRMCPGKSVFIGCDNTWFHC